MTGNIPPQLVLFDCDGVLVDSERPTILCLQENLSRHGLKLSFPEAAALLSSGTFAKAGDRARELGAILDEDWLETIYPELYARLDMEVGAIPGVDQVLHALDIAKISYAVCSNGRLKKMEIMLRRLGMWDRLKDRLYSAQALDLPKPAPDVYLVAAAEFGIPPSACVVIEDSATGAKAAHAAGMKCFGYTANTQPEKLAPFAETLFDNMKDLAFLLGLVGGSKCDR